MEKNDAGTETKVNAGNQILKTIFGYIQLVNQKLTGSKAAKKLSFITWDRIYLVFFILYFTYTFSRTMCITIPVFVKQISYGVIGVFTFLVWTKVVLFDIKKEKDILTILIPQEIGMVVTSLVWTYAYYPEAAVYYLFIIGARGVDFRKIAKAAIGVGVIMMITSTVLSSMGIITDLVYVEFGDRYRHSFGIEYTTDYAAHWFFIAALYFWLRNGKLKWYEIGAYIGLTAFLYIACYAKTDCICIMMLAVAGLVFNFDPGVKAFLKLKWVWIVSFAVLAVAALVICALFDPKNPVMVFLSEHVITLHHRFETTHKVLVQYPFSFFGQMFVERGLGGSTELVPEDEYSFVDISYVKIYIHCGVIVLVSLVALLTRFMYKRSKKADHAALAVMALLALYCFITHHLVDFSYDVLLLMLFADVDSNMTAKLPVGKKKAKSRKK